MAAPRGPGILPGCSWRENGREPDEGCIRLAWAMRSRWPRHVDRASCPVVHGERMGESQTRAAFASHGRCGQDGRTTWTGHPARLFMEREWARARRGLHSPRMGDAVKMAAPRGPGILPGCSWRENGREPDEGCIRLAWAMRSRWPHHVDRASCPVVHGERMGESQTRAAFASHGRCGKDGRTT